MESTLTGTAALVTGASSGIGAATARRLAGHGACVALVARRRDRLQALAAEIGEAGGTALAVEADITDRPQAEAAVQQAAERFGRLDTLVNNAAGSMHTGPWAGTHKPSAGARAADSGPESMAANGCASGGAPPPRFGADGRSLAMPTSRIWTSRAGIGSGPARSRKAESRSSRPLTRSGIRTPRG